MKTKQVQFLMQAAMNAAFCVVLTFLVNELGLASGIIQVRLSEILLSYPILHLMPFQESLSLGYLAAY